MELGRLELAEISDILRAGYAEAASKLIRAGFDRPARILMHRFWQQPEEPIIWRLTGMDCPGHIRLTPITAISAGDHPALTGDGHCPKPLPAISANTSTKINACLR